MGKTLLWVGRVVKTQGIRGQVRVSSEGETLTHFGGKTVYVEDPGRDKRALTVDSSRPYKGMIILSFREVKGIEEAEKLVGCSIYLNITDLEPLSPDEFYWYQLRGLKVWTDNGRFLGELEEVFPTGSNDVFVVRKEGREILIPATDEVVARVDLKRKVMVIHPLEGLLPEDDV